MAGKIFVNYRRDDDPSAAARLRDALAAAFGEANLFMDVDSLVAGQRFDDELTKALADCDVLVAVLGPRWLELLKDRVASGGRDLVREEIATAIARNIIVIPVRVGREEQMLALPEPHDLPEDVRELLRYQKHDVAHERFRRDIADLVAAIRVVRKPTLSPRSAPWRAIALGAFGAIGVASVGAYYAGVQLPGSRPPSRVETLIGRAETAFGRAKQAADRAREATRRSLQAVRERKDHRGGEPSPSDQ